jgi:hypothetical protein
MEFIQLERCEFISLLGASPDRRGNNDWRDTSSTGFAGIDR